MKTIAAFFLTLFVTSVFADTAPPPNLDATVKRAMQTFRVPGVSIAIVKDGKVVLAKGWGVRKLGEPAAVDADTLFQIASNSKDRFLDADAFVTFALNADGEVTSIAMAPVSTRTDFSFDFQDLALTRAK